MTGATTSTRTRTRNVLVLLSGGLDSGVLLFHAERVGRLKRALFAHYGQPAYAEEVQASRDLVTHLELPQTTLVEVGATVFGMDAMGRPLGETGPRVVPARNLVLLSLAVNLALASGCREVWLGATYDDCLEYVDCRPTFQEHMDRLVASLFGVRVKFPFQAMTKAQVVERGRVLGVPFAKTWSCYTPVDYRPCGTCNSCAQRAAALATTSVVDGAPVQG